MISASSAKLGGPNLVFLLKGMNYIIVLCDWWMWTKKGH